VDEGALGMMHLSLLRGYVEWASGRAPLLGIPEDEVFERYAKYPVGEPPLLQGPFWGTWRGFVCWKCLEKLIVYLASFLGSRGHQNFKSE
jgi:hypothetical protein